MTDDLLAVWGLSRPVRALLAGKPIFVSGARPRVVRDRLAQHAALVGHLGMRAGYRSGIGGTFVWLVA